MLKIKTFVLLNTAVRVLLVLLEKRFVAYGPIACDCNIKFGIRGKDDKLKVSLLCLMSPSPSPYLKSKLQSIRLSD
ncbi:hypothetical protein SAMD00079811_31340 [Scytonema sp. HK-05]|nr:hypothetical protein NIES2130_33225 [Scytonema sp. HK-05]BAY45530.1 hypothetical protein SAMD00079811_31340 [Scytonema sp. HK-05]